MTTKTPQAGTPAAPQPGSTQQQGSETQKPTQQQGGTRFTDWASI